VAAPVPSPSAPTPGGSPTFDTVLRGYERRQVDDYIARIRTEVAAVRDELADTQRQRKLATEHAEATETELRELRARSAHGEPAVKEDSFGYRAEKLLRMAEQEAAEARSHATKESAAIVERARTEAEKHRHEVEQNLIARASQLEQQAAQRNTELQEREQQIADQLTAARDQAEQLHTAATRAADRLREESEAAAAETRLRAETSAKRQQDQATQEIARLKSLQDDIRAELSRLADLLTGELAEGGRRAAENAERGQHRRPGDPQGGAPAKTDRPPAGRPQHATSR
jgi:cell division septum initiation protein DivIVA